MLFTAKSERNVSCVKIPVEALSNRLQDEPPPRSASEVQLIVPSSVVPYHSISERLCVHLIWAFRNQERFSKDSLLVSNYLYNGRPWVKRWNVPWEMFPSSKWRQNLPVQRYSCSHWKCLKFIQAEMAGVVHQPQGHPALCHPSCFHPAQLFPVPLQIWPGVCVHLHQITPLQLLLALSSWGSLWRQLKGS